MYDNPFPSPYRHNAIPVEYSTFLRRVYTWMALGLAATGLTALAVASSRDLLQLILGTPLLWVLIIAELVLVFVLARSVTRVSPGVATALFGGYAILNGATLAPIFLVYTGASIATTFFITGGTFAAMSVVGYTTKMDLSRFGSYFLMALIGVVLASVVNLFLHSTGLDLLISVVGVLLFVGLTAYDTQRIARMGEYAPNVAIQGALMLYLDFINLFLFMLRFLGRRRD